MFSEGIIYSGGACLASALCITLVVVAVVVVGIVAVTSGGDVPDPKAYESGSGLNYSTPTPTPTVTAVPVTVPPMTPDLNPSTPTPYPTNGCFHSGHCVDPYLTYTPGPTNSPTSTTASCFTGLNCSTYTPANTPTLMPLPTFDLDCALNPNACPFPGAPTNTSTLPPTNQNRTEQE